MKLDNVEALILTGEQDLEKAARKVAEWGCREIIITSAERAVCLVDGQLYSGGYCNRNSCGRTGRGDILVALTLVSIIMETPGPFRGTIEQVMARMGEVTVGKV